MRGRSGASDLEEIPALDTVERFLSGKQTLHDHVNERCLFVGPCRSSLASKSQQSSAEPFCLNSEFKSEFLTKHVVKTESQVRVIYLRL